MVIKRYDGYAIVIYIVKSTDKKKPVSFISEKHSDFAYFFL